MVLHCARSPCAQSACQRLQCTGCSLFHGNCIKGNTRLCNVMPVCVIDIVSCLQQFASNMGTCSEPLADRCVPQARNATTTTPVSGWDYLAKAHANRCSCLCKQTFQLQLMLHYNTSSGLELHTQGHCNEECHGAGAGILADKLLSWHPMCPHMAAVWHDSSTDARCSTRSSQA